MSNPFIGEIRLFAGTFPPYGWAFCDGQQLPISEYDTLFNLIGTTYGGDGQEFFQLPNLQGRVPVHQGQGPGLSSQRVIGEAAGVEQVTLTVNQTPVHSHAFLASSSPAETAIPQASVLAEGVLDLYGEPGGQQNLAAATVMPVGGNQPHENMQPFLAINFIISLFGIYPAP